MTLTARKVTPIDRKRASEFLWNETGGRIFRAFFMKKDKTMRRMTCRRGVKAYLAGGALPYDPKPRHLLTVFDMEIKQYRMIPLNRLVSFNIGNETFVIK